MPVYKCQNCGAILEISNDDDIVVCSYCGTAQSFRETRQDPDMISTWHDNLMKRAKMALEDGDYRAASKYAERALDQDAEDAEAYVVKFLARMEIKSLAEAAAIEKDFESDRDFQKACRFARDDLKRELDKILEKRQEIEHRIQEKEDREQQERERRKRRQKRKDIISLIVKIVFFALLLFLIIFIVWKCVAFFTETCLFFKELVTNRYFWGIPAFIALCMFLL